MSGPKSAAEWMEQTLAASSDHVDPVALLALAMLRDAKAELHEWGIGGNAECEECDVRGYGDDGKPCETCGGKSVRPVGWDAIEAKWREGGYR